jgi:magnesium chelatase accessory protein
VVGHSAGAALALRASLDGGLAPRCLIGINAALLPFSGPARLVLPALARVLHHQPWLADRVADLVARRAADGAGLQRLVRSTGSTLDATGLALYGRLISDPAHVRGALAMMAHWDLDQLQRDLLRAVDRAASSQTPTRLPTLHLVTGARDATVPPRQARTLHDALAGRPGWDMHLHELPGLGHLAHEEAPGRLAELILSLLAV